MNISCTVNTVISLLALVVGFKMSIFDPPHISMSCAEKHCNNCKINNCACKCHIEQMIQEADYEYSEQCKLMGFAELASEVNTLQTLYDRHKANQRDKDFVKILEIAQEALEERLK